MCVKVMINECQGHTKVMTNNIKKLILDMVSVKAMPLWSEYSKVHMQNMSCHRRF